MFIKYPKIHRVGREDVEGILDGRCVIQEKIDGANASVWLEERRIRCGSRNNDITGTDALGGFYEWTLSNENIATMVRSFPEGTRFYGEWLIKHTIPYNETAYRNFYLFDIFYPDVSGGDDDTGMGREPSSIVKAVAANFNVPVPSEFAVLDGPSLETLKSFLGQTELGTVGEGIVIRNEDYINKWGRKCYAKLVTEDFIETNAVVFGGNNKHSETYWELWIVNRFMTVGRIRKIMQKLESLTGEKMNLAHTPRVAGTAYHDMLEEEIWTIAKKVGQVDFKALKRIANKKAVQIYKDILSDDLSVAYKQ